MANAQLTNQLFELYELSHTSNYDEIGRLALEYLYTIPRAKPVILSILDKMPKVTAEYILLSLNPENEANRARVLELVNMALINKQRSPGMFNIMRVLFAKYRLFHLVDEFCEYFRLEISDAELIKNAFNKKPFDVAQYYQIPNIFYNTFLVNSAAHRDDLECDDSEECEIYDETSPSNIKNRSMFGYCLRPRYTFELINSGMVIDRLLRKNIDMQYILAQKLFVGWHIAYNKLNNLLYDVSFNLIGAVSYVNVRVIKLCGAEGGNPTYSLIGLAQECVGSKLVGFENPNFSINAKIALFNNGAVLSIEARDIVLSFNTENMEIINYNPVWPITPQFKYMSIDGANSRFKVVGEDLAPYEMEVYKNIVYPPARMEDLVTITVI